MFVRSYPEAATAVRQPGRLLVRRRRTDRDRAVRERPPLRRAERVRVDHRPALGHDPRRRRHHADARRERAAGGARRAPERDRRRRGSVGGSVVAIEPDTGAVKVMASMPGLRPQRDRRTRTTFDLLRRTRTRRSSTGPPEHLSAGLDDEGRDRDRGPRLGRVRDLDDAERELRHRDLRRAARELRRAGLRDDRHDDGADELGQHLLGAGGRAARAPETMVEYMERFGFYTDPELDYPDDQMAASGPYNSDGDLVERGLRRRPCRDRAGRRRGPAPGDADADGAGGRPRSPTTAS